MAPIRHAKKFYLELVCSCTNAAVALAPVYLWFQYLEWFFNGGGSPSTRMYGEIMHWMKCLNDDTEQREYFNVSEFGFDPKTCLYPTTLQAGQNKTFFIPIPFPDLNESCPIPLNIFKNKVKSSEKK